MPSHPKTPKTCFAYARVSTGRQAEKDLSIPSQLAQMRAFCEKHGITLVREYLEPGRSATNDNRPQFQRMMSDALNDPDRIDLIMVYAFSRAFRKLDDMIHHVRELRARKIRLMSITQDVDETPVGRLMMMIYGLVDELNSSENGKYVRVYRRANARLGHYNGAKPPFGYKAVALTILNRPGNPGDSTV